MVYMPGNSALNQGRGSLYNAPNQTGYQPPKPPVTKVGNGPNKSGLYGGGVTRGPSVQTTPGSSMYTTGVGTPGSTGVRPNVPGQSSMASQYNPMYQAQVSPQPVGQDYGVTRNGPGQAVIDQLTLPGSPGSPAGPYPGGMDWPTAVGEYLNDAIASNPGYFDQPAGSYRPGMGGNPAPPGWNTALPRPPANVVPGTPEYRNWLESVSGIEGSHPYNFALQEELYREGAGYTDPRDVAPWTGGAAGYSKYVDNYLQQMGLGAGQAPDAFRQDLYGQVMGDAQAGAQTAASMAGDAFDAEDATHFGALSNYANNLYDEELGGLAGFDYRPLQEAGIAQAEIARAATESQMAQQLAGTGLSGQANSIYAQAPMYNDYMQNRISAMTDPAMRSAELGIQGMGMASGQLNDLYGLQQQGDLAAAGLYRDLYGQGLGTAANVGLGAGQSGLDAFLQQQELYSQMPMQGYATALQAAMAQNANLDSLYGNALDREDAAKGRKVARQGQDSNVLQSIIGLADFF